MAHHCCQGHNLFAYIKKVATDIQKLIVTISRNSAIQKEAAKLQILTVLSDFTASDLTVRNVKSKLFRRKNLPKYS